MSYKASSGTPLPPRSCLECCCSGRPCSSAEAVLHQSGPERGDFKNTPQGLPLSPKPADHPGISSALGQPTAHSTSAQPCAMHPSLCPVTLSLRTAVAMRPPPHLDGAWMGLTAHRAKSQLRQVCFRPGRGAQRHFQQWAVDGCGDWVRSHGTAWDSWPFNSPAVVIAASSGQCDLGLGAHTHRPAGLSVTRLHICKAGTL